MDGDLGCVSPKCPFLLEVAFGNGLYCRYGKQTRTPLKSSFHLRNQSFNTQAFSGYSPSKLQNLLRFCGVTIFYINSVSCSFKFRSVFFSASLISRNAENLPKLLSHLWNFLPVFSVFLIFLQLYILYLNIYVNFMSSVVLGNC